MRNLYQNRFLRGIVLVALVSLAIVLLSLENSLATASALLSIAFFLAIAFFLFLLWRERRSDIEAWSDLSRRTFYGAIVLGQSPEVLTASAASPVAAQTLGAVAAQLQGQLQQAAAAQAAAQGAQPPTVTVTVTDVVPLADTDEHGAGLASAVLPLVSCSASPPAAGIRYSSLTPLMSEA